MSLKDIIQSASLSVREVQICLDGALVFEREQAIAALNAASIQMRMAAAQSREHRQEAAADARLGVADPVHAEIERVGAAAGEEVESARARVVEIEERMRAAEVTFRFTALPKHEFEQLRIEAKNDAGKLYGLLARASGQHVDGDTLADIDPEVWDLLEPKLTRGQWELIISALDQINVVEGKQGLSFLRSVSPPTQS